jgi:signal transduction histidine kinase
MQAEQLATTGRLAASIAHEINNPLEAVTNLLYLLRDETDETARKEYLRTAESELARASEIAANTLRFYRDPKGLSRVGLGPLLQSVVGLFQGRLAIRGIELNLTCEEGVEVTASQGELRQVLVHLIGNALDAMPNGGRLLVRCRAFPRAIGNMEPGAGICIADTGTGMSQELLGRVFEPFYTTKGSSGTGVGLWLSREIVRKYGFKLLVKSKVERGTVFSIYMPQRTDPA